MATPQLGTALGVPELVGALGQDEEGAALGQGGQRGARAAVGHDDVAPGEQQRLGDVALDVHIRRLGAQLRRVTVRADGDDHVHRLVAQAFDGSFEHAGRVEVP